MILLLQVLIELIEKALMRLLLIFVFLILV
jgi:hypothetical protein